jgi:hypothetical protein
MSFVVLSGDWEITLSHDARPSSTQGATITPGNNTPGSWTQIMGPTSTASHVIEIIVGGIGVSASATDSLTDIGIDPAGGTSYTTMIPSLLSSYAVGVNSNNAGFGCSWLFPVYIPAGATIAARGSINNATVGTQQVYCKLYRALDPSRVRTGTGVIAYGATAASSTGTAVTFGTAAVGSYTQLGSAVSALAPWHWLVSSARASTTTVNASTYVADLAIGDASNKRVIVARQESATNSNEQRGAVHRGFNGQSAVGDLVYVRGWAGDAATTYTAIAYGVYGDAY